MKLKQLSLFVENRAGALKNVCRTLKEKNINIYTLSLAETDRYGILRLLVRDPESARETLAASGIVANLAEVLAIPVPDRPGGLAELLEKLDRYGLNIDYMYAFTNGTGGDAVMVFRFADTDRALEALAAEGIETIDADRLFA